MSDALYYSTFAVTFVLVLVMFTIARSAIRHGRDRKFCTNTFTAAASLTGFLSGIAYYYGAMWVLDTTGHRVNVGHGEVLIAAPLFNLILGLALAMVGRMLLQWRPVKW